MIRSQKHTIIIILLLAAACLVHSKLEVTNLNQLNLPSIDEDLKNIPYSIANFGFAPFGKTLVGHLEQTPGLSNQCTVNGSQTPSPSIQTSFLLIPRGECPFVTKAIHAQELGAKMAIIMDNQDHAGAIIMKDNGYGYKVQIPSIFINYKMGQKLKDLLSQTKVQVNLRITFENTKSEKAEVVVYMQSLNRLSYYFVQQFNPYYNLIKNHINFKVAYNVINCPICSADDCYYEGQYCSVSYDHEFSASGKLLMDQQLREQIMFEKHIQQWWPYMNCISNQCNKISEVKECSDKCLTRSEFSVKPDDLAKQLAQSFAPNNDNSYLRRSTEYLKNSGVQTFPSVSINGVKVRGSVSAEFVFDDICNSLLKPPKQCTQYIIEKDNNVEINNTYWITIVLVLLLSAVLFVGLFIFCRRRMRSKMTAEMQGRVDDMVSKYIEFYSERRNNK